jgi:hypothetical protein
MKAMVVYESMFGATHEVAAAVAEGLRGRFDVVDVVPVAGADSALVVEADLLVVGGPTHAHGMTRPSTRQAAVDNPTKYGGTHPLEPGAEGPGVREWLESLPHTNGFAVAFDTRGDAPAMLTGRASSRIAHRLRWAGRTTVMPPESFVVARGGALRDGEHERAVAWGRTVATVASSQVAGHAS